jgi:hypothetical protein
MKRVLFPLVLQKQKIILQLHMLGKPVMRLRLLLQIKMYVGGKTKNYLRARLFGIRKKQLAILL